MGNMIAAVFAGGTTRRKDSTDALDALTRHDNHDIEAPVSNGRRSASDMELGGCRHRRPGKGPMHPVREYDSAGDADHKANDRFCIFKRAYEAMTYDPFVVWM